MLPLSAETAFLIAFVVAAVFMLRLLARQEQAHFDRLEELIHKLERLRETDNEPDGR